MSVETEKDDTVSEEHIFFSTHFLFTDSISSHIRNNSLWERGVLVV